MRARRENSFGGGNTRCSWRTEVIPVILSITAWFGHECRTEPWSVKVIASEEGKSLRKKGFYPPFRPEACGSRVTGQSNCTSTKRKKRMKKGLIILGAAVALVGCKQQGGTGTSSDTTTSGSSSPTYTTPSSSSTLTNDTSTNRTQTPKSSDNSSQSQPGSSSSSANQPSSAPKQ
jgi:hypothetical protein